MGGYVAGCRRAEVLPQVPGVNGLNHLVHVPGAAGQGFDYLLLPGLPMVDVPLYALGSVVDQLPVAGTDQVWALPGQQLLRGHVLLQVADAG